MRHLSPSEFIELLEGTLPPDRTAHLSTCDGCRAQAEAARSALTTAEAVDVPEPSPLFWDHLSARVRGEIDDEAAPRVGWWRRPGPVLSSSLAAFLLAFIVVHQVPRHAGTDTTAAALLADLRAAPVEGADPAWDLLVSELGNVQGEDPREPGLSVRTATVDSAVLELTPAEREELGRLLQEEMKHSGA